MANSTSLPRATAPTFFSLALETRRMIYQEVLREDQRLVDAPAWYDGTIDGHHFSDGHVYEAGTPVRDLHPALLETSRQIRTEATATFAASLRPLFGCQVGLPPPVFRCGSRAYYNRVTAPPDICQCVPQEYWTHLTTIRVANNSARTPPIDHMPMLKVIVLEQREPLNDGKQTTSTTSADLNVERLLGLHTRRGYYEKYVRLCTQAQTRFNRQRIQILMHVRVEKTPKNRSSPRWDVVIDVREHRFVQTAQLQRTLLPGEYPWGRHALKPKDSGEIARAAREWRAQ